MNENQECFVSHRVTLTQREEIILKQSGVMHQSLLIAGTFDSSWCKYIVLGPAKQLRSLRSVMFTEQIGRAMPDIWFTVLHSTSWAFCPVQRPGSHLYSRCLWCHVATVTKWYVETCHRIVRLCEWRTSCTFSLKARTSSGGNLLSITVQEFAVLSIKQDTTTFA